MAGIEAVSFAGTPLIAGTARASALAADVPLSLWGGLDPETGTIIDRHHPLAGACLAGRILCLPAGRGSCSASGVLLEAIRAGTAPAAIVLSRPDPVIGLGAILGEELYGRTVPVVVVAEAERARIRAGDLVAIAPDGTVTVERAHAGDPGREAGVERTKPCPQPVGDPGSSQEQRRPAFTPC